MMVDTRWIGPHGIGRFAREVIRRLDGAVSLPLATDRLSPFDPIRIYRALRRSSARSFFSPGFNPPLGRPCPFVFTIHDLIHLRFGPERTPSKEGYYGLIVRPATRKAAAVLTVSEFSRREILEWSGIPEDRVRVAGNGVGPEFHPEVPPHVPGYPYILFVGGSKPHKNLLGLIEALSLSRLRDVRLLVVGSIRGCESRIASLGMRDRIVVEKGLAEDALPSRYRGAIALAIPSFYEGFGLPAIEAMACGTPVLASRAASLPEVVGDAGILVDPRQIEDMAGAIRRLAEDSRLRATLRERGLSRARRFSWENAAETVRAAMDDAERIG